MNLKIYKFIWILNINIEFEEHEEDYYNSEEDEEEDYFGDEKAEVEEQKEVQIIQPIDEQNDELISMSISMKIIYLEKLGIIDFLQKEEPFNMSINSLAKVFGRIIGAKPATVQPCLNAMLGKTIHTKNNPLNSEKNVESVEYFLSKLGYKLRKKREID